VKKWVGVKGLFDDVIEAWEKNTNSDFFVCYL